jgi:hypothetical protein
VFRVKGLLPNMGMCLNVAGKSDIDCIDHMTASHDYVT